MPALSSHTLHSTIRMRITLHLARNWRLFSEGEKMDSEQDLRENQRQYLDFLDDNEDQGVYHEKVKDMVRSHGNRLIVNINDLRRKNAIRAARLLSEANIELLAFQRALRECVLTVDDAYGKQYEFNIGFEGSFGSKHVTPRTLSAHLLGSLVCVEGIITKSSLVRPKVVKSVHYCPATGKTMERKYTDLTSLEAFPTSSVYPTKDEDGNSLETEYGLSKYRDHQTLTIQETPERAPAGQLPRALDIILDGDLVDSCKPGDRVHIVGTYRCLPGKKVGYTSGTFRTILLACSVIQQNKEATPLFSRRDVVKIKKFSKSTRFDPFEMLAHSLAPSIHGHSNIKRAVLAMLLGGVEKILENGTRLRGDINILLVGDPSTAKSQMLRYVLHSAPRAVTTTGRGTSGVGLTAAVTTDMETGDRQLEAGAMVLADRGVVCIDEFDKMSDLDRTAIHEVMEQGRVTIAKAGIHAKLNARCSVLAAANPVYGRYDDYKPPMDNIGMQDSLLSRFDLIFVVLDEMDPEQDRRISEHVLRMHRYRNPGEQDGEILIMGGDSEMLATGASSLDGGGQRTEEEEDEGTNIFDKHDNMLHGHSKMEKYVSSQFMKKYIHVARALKPVLTREACDLISTEYAKLRAQETFNRDTAKTQPVTARTLETLIRLSTAHAKARMSKLVEEQDAESAINLINFAYFKKVAIKPKKRKDEAKESGKRKRSGTAGGDSEKKVKLPRKKPGEEGYDPYDFTSSESEGEGLATPITQPRNEQEEKMETGPVTMSTERLSVFRSKVSEAFSEEHAQSLQVARLEELVNSSCQFSSDEVMAGLVAMEEANQVMVSEGVVFLI